MIAILQQTLTDELPASIHLGVRVVRADPGHVTLEAPLAPNRNHRGSAFAGSLNAVATLAGWSWLWVYLRTDALDAQVVLQDSSIQFGRPVRSDFRATCPEPSATSIARFRAALARSGRGRLTLAVEVFDADGSAVRFSGRYVAERVSLPGQTAG